MITLLLVAAAIAVVFWPASKSAAVPSVPDLFSLPAVKAAASPDSREAIDSLLQVRDRLAASGNLSDQSAKAVDQLWLDLLHGSNPK